jgi:hypothetical protein
MASRVDDFLAKTRQVLRDRVGGRCSRPECERHTVSPCESSASKVEITGRAAHITGAQKLGPRYDPALTSEQRRAPDNGIWLCSDCADLIDKNSGEGFTVGQLRSWKRVAEGKLSAAARLAPRARRPVWLDRLRTAHYVNVPRMLQIAGPDVLSARASEALVQGFSKDRTVLRELVEVETALRQMTIRAVDVQEIAEPARQLSEGLVISFHCRCRTKNGGSERPEDVTNFSFERSPLIYLDCNGYRYIQPFDPMWITTNTARSSVRSGSARLAGIALVKDVDHAKRVVVASPLTFGIPDISGLFE